MVFIDNNNLINKCGTKTICQIMALFVCQEKRVIVQGIQLIEIANVKLKRSTTLPVHWTGNGTEKWKFLPWTHAIPHWGGIPPQLGTTDLKEFTD